MSSQSLCPMPPYPSSLSQPQARVPISSCLSPCCSHKQLTTRGLFCDLVTLGCYLTTDLISTPICHVVLTPSSFSLGFRHFIDLARPKCPAQRSQRLAFSSMLSFPFHDFNLVSPLLPLFSACFNSSQEVTVAVIVKYSI